jgi:hypothetical protein
VVASRRGDAAALEEFARDVEATAAVLSMPGAVEADREARERRRRGERPKEPTEQFLERLRTTRP